jgi:hypothetical protein
LDHTTKLNNGDYVPQNHPIQAHSKNIRELKDKIAISEKGNP